MLTEYRGKLTLLDGQTITFSWVRFSNPEYTVKMRKLMEEKFRRKKFILTVKKWLSSLHWQFLVKVKMRKIWYRVTAKCMDMDSSAGPTICKMYSRNFLGFSFPLRLIKILTLLQMVKLPWLSVFIAVHTTHHTYLSFKALYFSYLLMRLSPVLVVKFSKS